MNIYLGTMNNLETFEGILGTLIVPGIYNSPQLENTN